MSAPDAETGTHSFHSLLSNFPEDNAAGATEDISVHMAGFIHSHTHTILFHKAWNDIRF